MADLIFADKDQIGLTELMHDVEYRYIPEGDKQMLIDMAWEKGIRAAEDCKQRFPEAKDPVELAAKLGVKITYHESGPNKIFSEYYGNLKEIKILQHSIRDTFLPYNQDTLSSTDITHICNLFITHELFHHLECYDPQVGLTYQQYKVTVFSFGPFKYKVGLRSLSEIAAHSFTRALLGFTDKY